MLPRWRRFAIGLAGHPADGDDLCQMTIERALTRKDQFQDGTRLDSWMYRIMRNIWIDESRARTRRSQTFAAEDAGLAVGAAGSKVIGRASCRERVCQYVWITVGDGPLK